MPWLYSWRIRSRIYRWYGSLISLERSALAEATDAEREAMVKRLDEIENAVNQMKVPLAFADQFYILRVHIGFVRERLLHPAEAHGAAPPEPSPATPPPAAHSGPAPA